MSFSLHQAKTISSATNDDDELSASLKSFQDLLKLIQNTAQVKKPVTTHNIKYGENF